MPLSTRPDDLANSLSKAKMNLERLSGTLDGWQRGGQSYPDFDYMAAERAEFVYPPWDTAGFRMASTLEFTTAVWTAIPFDVTDWNTGIIDYSTASTGLFRFTRPSDFRTLLVFGHISWRYEASSGPHGIRITSYPSTQDVVMSELHADQVAQSYSYMYRMPSGTTAFDIEVFARNLPYLAEASLGLWEITRQ